ncbi:thioredoxin-dependent thiol peroxidase [Bacteriovoracaceae bacterium]|nr:thioredoxin-dependent thiol peroxidase [Bacteriovoracaceae bacterium]
MKKVSILEEGKKAPAFTLKNQNGDKISLKDVVGDGYVLVYFYPRALTPGCTVQACSLKDSKSQLSRNKIKVFGISNDPIEKLKKFEEKYKLNFDLLSDEDKKISNKYGVWGLKKFMGREFEGLHRVSFIVGPDGKVKKVFPKVKTKTHHEDVLAAIKELKK